MRIRITAGGIFGHVTDENPSGELAIGTELTLDNEPTGWTGRYVVLDAGDTAGKSAVTNPAEQEGKPAKTADEPKALKGPFTVGDPAIGWYPVLDADGVKVKNLRKDDAEAFATLSDDDKLAYLSE